MAFSLTFCVVAYEQSAIPLILQSSSVAALPLLRRTLSPKHFIDTRYLTHRHPRTTVIALGISSHNLRWFRLGCRHGAVLGESMKSDYVQENVMMGCVRICKTAFAVCLTAILLLWGSN